MKLNITFIKGIRKLAYLLNICIFEKIICPKINPFKPDKTFGNFCTIFSLIFVTFVIIYAPLDIAFNLVDQNKKPYDKNLIYPMALVIIILDMLINVNTAFYSRGVLQLKNSKIIKNYLRKQFTLDLSYYYL